MTVERDWMFCPITGELLRLDAAAGVAVCDASGFQRSLKGAGG